MPPFFQKSLFSWRTVYFRNIRDMVVVANPADWFVERSDQWFWTCFSVDAKEPFIFISVRKTIFYKIKNNKDFNQFSIFFPVMAAAETILVVSRNVLGFERYENKILFLKHTQTQLTNLYQVISTSMQRHDIDSTLYQLQLWLCWNKRATRPWISHMSSNLLQTIQS